MFLEFRRLDTLHDRKAHLFSLCFLLRCRDAGIIPRFIKMKRTLYSPQAHRIYNRSERAFLRERIHSNRRSLAIIDSKLLELHLLLSGRMSQEDWDNISHLIHIKTEKKREKYNDKLKRKFKHLNTVQLKPPLDMTRTVVNLSDRELKEEETSVLAKGGNFAITPSVIPTEDIIANVEAAITKLPSEAAEEIRTETARILKQPRMPPSNLSNKEKQALSNLNKDKDIIILPADKGNATVVMRTMDYQDKIKELLDPSTYQECKRDPTNRILRLTQKLVKSSSIPEDQQRQLYTSEALPPRLYGLPKIHKSTVPLRPIVNAIGSPTYKLAKYLTTILQPFIGQTPSYIRDSAHFIERLQLLNITTDDILVSFDIVSLFTNVPIHETCNLLTEIFPEDISKLFHHCLTTSYFQWNGVFYEQLDGVAMGSPLSPVVANFYMQHFEETALNQCTFKPTTWFRYVDDTFVIWSHGQDKLKVFLEELNSIHPKIQFTMEVEQDRKLPFLDVLVTRGEDLQLHHTVYRKPTHTDRYLHKSSNHHPRQKSGIIKTLTERAIRICEPNALKDELKHLQTALLSNGYTTKEINRSLKPNITRRRSVLEPAPVVGKAFLPYIKHTTDRIGKILGKFNIKTIYKPTTKIENLLRSAKDKRDPLTSAGIYRIPCSCGKVYIGTTQRSILTRRKEHQRHCRLGQTDKSAVAEHTLFSPGHDIDFKNTQLIANNRNYHVRLHREAIEIHKHNNNFNRKEESLKLNKIWLPALKNTTTRPLPSASQSATTYAPIATPTSLHRKMPDYIAPTTTSPLIIHSPTIHAATPEDDCHSSS